MKSKHLWVLLAALALLVSPAACGKSGDKENNLKLALTMMPADTLEFQFSDWSLIKTYEGFGDLSSKDSMEKRMEFMRQAFSGDFRADPPVLPRQALFAGYAIGRFQRFAETWGWDSTDLIWEATVHIDSPPTGRFTAPLYVLQFPGDFDFAPLQALFEQRGFSQSDFQGVTIYSHKMDLTADWVKIGELAIVNTAVIEEDHRLVLSTQLEAIQAVLDAYKGEAQSLADNSTAEAITERLGESAGAHIKVGSESCTIVDDSPGGRLEKVTQNLSEEQASLLEELLEKRSQLRSFTGLGIGYRYEQDELTSSIVMHYTSADSAKADLELRRQMAQEGISFQYVGQPYSERLFTLDEASVEGSDLVFQVSPISGMPRRLFDMVIVDDMLFASCP